MHPYRDETTHKKIVAAVRESAAYRCSGWGLTDLDILTAPMSVDGPYT